MLIWLVFLATVAVIGFVQDDLFYLASEGRSFEELDYTRGEPYLFYIDPIKIQVFPNTSQTEQADFIFTFQLYRDTGVVNDTLYQTKHHNTSFIKVDFSEYFGVLDTIGEQREDNGDLSNNPTKLDAELW